MLHIRFSFPRKMALENFFEFSKKKKSKSLIISDCKRAWSLILATWNVRCKRMLFAKFRWNWPSVFGGEKRLKMLNVYGATGGRRDRQTDDRQNIIRKAHMSWKLRWAKSLISSSIQRRKWWKYAFVNKYLGFVFTVYLS